MPKILLEVTYDSTKVRQIDITNKIREISGVTKILIGRFSKPDRRTRGY